MCLDIEIFYAMYKKIYILLLFLLGWAGQKSYAQATIVRPFMNFGGGVESSPGGSIVYFSMGRVAITPPKHQGLTFSFEDENPDNPRLFEGALLAPSRNVLTEYEIGIADLHTKSNFVIDLFQYAWGRNENKTYRYDRISTGMGFQLNMGRNVWLRQVNYLSVDWLGNVLLDNIPINGGVSGNFWFNDEVYSEEASMRLLIRQTQLSYRPQVSLGLKFSESFLLSLNAGYIIPFSKSSPNILLKPRTNSETEEFSRTTLSADRINLRNLSNNTPALPSSFQLNRWYVNVRLAVHVFGD